MRFTQSLAPSLTTDVIRESVLGTVLSLVNDPIPNIRFNVAKALEVLSITLANSPDGKDLARTRVVPAVQSLRNDSDPDVRYFAGKAFEKAAQLSVVG